MITVEQFKAAGDGTNFGLQNLDITFDTTPAVGSSVFVLIPGRGDSGVWNVSDNQGNTYEQHADVLLSVGTHLIRMLVYSAIAETASGTFTVSVSCNFFRIVQVYIVEGAGFLGAHIEDVTQSASGASGDPDTGASTATAEPNEVVFAIASQEGAIALTPDSYISLGSASRLSGTMVVNASYKIATAVGTQQETWTPTLNMSEWGALLITFYSGAQFIRPDATSAAGNWSAEPPTGELPWEEQEIQDYVIDASPFISEQFPVHASIHDGKVWVAFHDPGGHIGRHNDPKNDLSDYDIDDTDSTGFESIVYSANNDKMYAVRSGINNNAQVYDTPITGTLTMTKQINDSITDLEGGVSSWIHAGLAVIIGDFLYTTVRPFVGGTPATSHLLKYDLTDFSRDSSVALTNLGHVSSMAYDGTWLVLGSYAGTAGDSFVIRVNPTTLAFTSQLLDDTNTLRGPAHEMAITGGFAHIGFRTGKVVAVEIADITNFDTFDTGETETVSGVAVYVGYLWVTLYADPGLVVRMELDGTNPTAFTASRPQLQQVLPDEEDDRVYIITQDSPGPPSILRFAPPLHEYLADDDDATYADLNQGDDPSTMVLALADASEPVAGDGAVVVRVTRT